MAGLPANTEDVILIRRELQSHMIDVFTFEASLSDI